MQEAHFLQTVGVSAINQYLNGKWPNAKIRPLSLRFLMLSLSLNCIPKRKQASFQLSKANDLSRTISYFFHSAIVESTCDLVNSTGKPFSSISTVWVAIFVHGKPSCRDTWFCLGLFVFHRLFNFEKAQRSPSCSSINPLT